MKPLRLFAIVSTLALLALPAFGATSLITPDGIRYAIERTPDLPQIEITRAEGGNRARLIVPTTEDTTGESQAQIAFDPVTDTLYVVWTRETEGRGEVRYATLNAAGYWSPARNIAAGSGMYRGLQLALTRSEYGGIPATFMHLAWWSINGPILDPEYALFAFENGKDVSAEVENLDEMALVGDGVTASDFDDEDMGASIHPPLTMERSGDGVDLAFGSTASTSVTRINIVPRKIGGNVRIWKPVGRGAVSTPKSSLVSNDATPVQAFIRDGRLALYTVGEDFRFVVLKKNNTWTPLYSVQVDEDNPSTDLLRDLRASIQEISDDEETTTANEEAPATR